MNSKDQASITTDIYTAFQAHANEIETCAWHIAILLTAIDDRLQSVGREVADPIQCFVELAREKLQRLESANEKAASLLAQGVVRTGGAA